VIVLDCDPVEGMSHVATKECHCMTVVDCSKTVGGGMVALFCNFDSPLSHQHTVDLIETGCRTLVVIVIDHPRS
jgi:hypothetical protein